MGKSIRTLKFSLLKQNHQHIKEGVLQAPSIWTEINLLVKMKLSATVVFSSVMAYAIAAVSFNIWTALILITGGMLITGAANALNQVLERDYDALMDRTKNRPLAANRMTVSSAVLIAGLAAVVGTLLLTIINPLAGFIGIVSMVLYSFIYTPLKRFGPSAVFVGAIPGALPVLIGAIVGSGQITILGMLLFGIQFFWQLPHFWAIAWMGHDDYAKANFRLLPNPENELKPSIGTHSLIQALFIIPLLGLGVYYNTFSYWSAILATVVTLWYAYLGFNLFQNPGREAAKKLMFGSFAYLPIVLFILLLNSLVGWI